MAAFFGWGVEREREVGPPKHLQHNSRGIDEWNPLFLINDKGYLYLGFFFPFIFLSTSSISPVFEGRRKKTVKLKDNPRGERGWGGWEKTSGLL